MKKKKSEKSIAHRYWKQFEDLSYALIKDRYKLQPKLEGKITERTHDGGYDGIIWFSDQSRGLNELFKILLESKLRTNNKTALPMNDFSKVMIIAVNMIADCVYISTNSFFSMLTLKQLDEYSRRTGLEIKTINLKDILSWVDQHKDWSFDDKEDELIKHLRQMASNVDMCNWPTIPEQTIKKQSDKLIGRERNIQRDKVLRLLSAKNGIYMCSGQAGMGKTMFFREVMHSYRKTPHETLTINLHNYPTSREVFVAFLSSIWGVGFSEICHMSYDELKEVTKYLGEELFPLEQQQSLISIINRPQCEYDKNHVINDAILVDYISRIFNPILRRIPHFIIIENAHNTTAGSLQFLLRIIKCLADNQITFLVEERTDFDETHALSLTQWQDFFYDLRRMSIFIFDIQLKPFSQNDCEEFIKSIDPICSSEKARSLAKIFGGIPLYLATGIDLIKDSDVYELWIPDASSIVEYEIAGVGYIEQAIKRFFTSSDVLTQRLLMLLALFDGRLDTIALNYFFSKEDIETLKALLHQSIYIHVDEACAVIKHELYYRCMQKLDYTTKRFLLQITDEANRFVCSELKDAPTVWRKRFEFAKLTNNANSIVDFWWDYTEYLRSLCETNLVLEILHFVYECNNQEQILLTDDQRYHLLSALTEAKITAGQGHSPEVSSYLSEMETSIHLYKLSGEKTSLRMASLLHSKCSIALSGGDYKKLKQYANDGMSLDSLKQYHLSRFYNYYALAVKHLENHEKCLNFLENHKDKMESDIEFQSVLNTNRASNYTGSDPKRALSYFKDIQQLRESSSLPPSLHHEHNIATMLFMCADIDAAEELCRKTWMNAYRTNDRVEEGRSLHLLGCIYWYKGDFSVATDWFSKSYQLFEHITHKTHVWRPAANLASLYFERESSYHPQGLFYAQIAVEHLLGSHITQINNINVSRENLHILYIGALTMLYKIWWYKPESKYIEKILTKITLPEFAYDFEAIKRENGVNSIFKDSAYWINGRVILKV